jgi:RNA polymerase sigma factor (sigma-70 family)
VTSGTSGPRDAAEERGRKLSSETLEALLDRLDPDRDRAAERYREIHQRLVRLYEWRGCPSPEELADETLDRVAVRLASGVEIRSPDHYISRVSYLVFREIVRREQRRRRALAAEKVELRSAVLRGPEPEVENEEEVDRRRCLHRCLDRLHARERENLLRYYQDEKGAKIRNRRRLAAELGVAAGALRIRMYRLRQRLERCIVQCLAEVETDRAEGSH